MKPLPQLDSIPGHDFEDLIETLLSRMGFHISGRQAAADGGIDMIAINTNPIVGGKYIIQCKRYSGPVGSPFVRDLFGVVHSESANKGVLITNSSFSAEAVRFARGKPLELIDGGKLEQLMADHGIAMSEGTGEGSSVTPGIRVIYAELVPQLSKIIASSDRLGQGLVHVERTRLTTTRSDVSRYQKIMLRCLGFYMDTYKTMGAVLGNLAAPICEQSPSKETISSIRDGVHELLKIARTLLRTQQDLEAIAPPKDPEAIAPLPDFTNVHLAFVRVAPSLLQKLWSLAEFAADRVEGKFGDGPALLKIDLDGSELKPMLAALNDLNGI